MGTRIAEAPRKDRVARRRLIFFGVFRGTVWEKISVCFPRDGDGTEEWEAIWWMGRDGRIRF